MKKKRWIISLIVTIFALIISGIILFNLLANENKLTSEEVTWISENINNVQNIYIVKGENIFSKNGEGVFYDFINDFSNEYGININVVSALDNNNKVTNNLNYTKTLNENVLY